MKRTLRFIGNRTLKGLTPNKEYTGDHNIEKQTFIATDDFGDLKFINLIKSPYFTASGVKNSYPL